MPLTLVLGPANSAKAGEVLGAYADAAPRGAVLVVPTALDARHYARELAAGGNVLGAVRTFAGLAAEIAARTDYAARLLSGLQRDHVLTRVVRRASLDALAGSAEGAGFVTAAGKLIAELQRSLITPDRFTRALAGWAAADRRRADYAREVGWLYESYVRELDRLGRVDAERYAWRALDALRAQPGRWGPEPVFFYGFDELTPLERDAVETLAGRAGAQVTVSLTYEPGRVALAGRATAVEELRVIAERVQELPALDEHYEPAARPALHRLERRLFEPAQERVDPGPAVRLLEAGGERAEAELVAAEVLSLLSRGVPAEEIVVVYRSLERAAATVERVFAEYGIELSHERLVPLAHTALGRGLLALARCAWQRVPPPTAADLLQYLRCPGVLDRGELADALEAELLEDAVATAAGARDRLGWRLEEIEALRSDPDRSCELLRQARRLFTLPHASEAAILDDREELDARALATIVGALAEIEELGLAEPMTGLELIELLERLDVAAPAAADTGAVLLAEPLTIRARRFRAVFVCGLQEGEFPVAGAPDPFLSDERRWELGTLSGLRLPPTEDALARERYLFYACVSRATEQVVLSFRSSDEEGNLALASPFVADVAEVMVQGWAQRRRRRLLADVVWPPGEAPTPRELERARAAQAAAAPSVCQRSVADGACPTPSRVLSGPALERLRHRRILSGGALESYANCPVSWLVERQLAPRALAPESDPIARGNYMHAALERTVRRLGSSVTPSTLARASRILDDVLAELPATVAPASSPGVRAAALSAAAADLHRYLERESNGGAGWDPDAVELKFGFEGEPDALPGLTLGEGDEQIVVRGVIDRIDVEPGPSRRAIVRDYKSGGTRPEHQGAHWRADRQLQVALYMLAVRQLLGLDPVAGLYQPLGGGDLRARGIYLDEAPVGAGVVVTDARTRDEIEAELDDAATRALALAARLRAGELTPCPQTCSRDGCMYPGICRSRG